MREIVLRSINKQYAVTNFAVNLGADKYHRLKIEDILINEHYETTAGRKKDRLRVNWAFWNDFRKKHPYYCLYLDELHNVISSRQSMSSVNIQMSRFISQIRKVLFDKADNHIFLITQKLKKIDVDWRDLVHLYIECSKIKIGDGIYIKQKFYNTIEAYECGYSIMAKVFRANGYFKYYDSLKMVKFEDSEVYI